MPVTITEERKSEYVEPYESSLPAPPSTSTPAVQTSGRSEGSQRGWPRWVTLLVGTVAMTAVGVTALLYSQAVSDRNDAEDDLASAEAELAASEDLLAEVETQRDEALAELSASEASLKEAEFRGEAMGSAIESAIVAGEAVAADGLNLDPVFAQEVIDAGADMALAEDLLRDLGHPDDLQTWVASDAAWWEVNGKIQAIDDDELDDAWVRWNNSEIGSPEELAASWDYYWRLAHLVLEPLNDVAQTVDAANAASTLG